MYDQMSINLSGRLALVTGSSGGIGRGIALALAKAGARVAVHYGHREEEGKVTVNMIEQFGGTAALFQADVSKVNEIERMFNEVESSFGECIDILVNNAGHLIQRSNNEEMTEELYDKVMNVNVKSTVFACKRALPGMRVKGRGGIINMASIAVHNGGGVGASVYAASKAAVFSYTKGLAKEVAVHGIRANTISPGLIGETAFHDTFTPMEVRNAAVTQIPLGREGTPKDVAGTALFLLSDLSSYITGEMIEINGGLIMR